MFLDTSGLLNYQSDRETQHDVAVALFERPGVKLTHSYVLSEFVALAQARKLPRGPALALLRRLIAHPEVHIVWVTEELHHRALSLLESRMDKTYSLCDAASFVLMNDRGIRVALTTDRHFVQEGFQRLLSEDDS